MKNLAPILGKPRNLGQGTERLPADFTFGRPSDRKRDGEWSCEQCLKGQYSVEEQLPDVDVGKSTTPGFRNITTETRAFGMPSARPAAPPGARRSIADPTCYGSSNAAELIKPSELAEMSIDSSVFDHPRSREEIADLFDAIGQVMPRDVFDIIFTSVEDRSGRASVAAFRSELVSWQTAVDLGEEDLWRGDRGV